jgi:subtilisin family serine protease
MKGFVTSCFSFLVVFCFSASLSAADYKPGEIIVKFKPNPAIQALQGFGDSRPYAVAVDDTAKALDELQGRSDIDYAEPNYIIEAEALPNDWPYGNAEWEGTGMGAAFDFIAAAPAGNTVRIAVVDSGVDADHPELADVLIPGHDFANGDSEPEDDAGHGTKVCGIIGAKGGNAYGSAGVAWNTPVEIMPLKFMKLNGGSTTGCTSDAVDAIYYAVDHGATIINASWGFSSYSSALKDAIKYARDHGVLFVASAGNKGQDNDTVPHYPSNYQLANVIAVAAMNRYGELASFSNYGRNSVHVSAPGSGLKTTDINGGIASWVSGTSFAAPWVVGVAAMVASQNPSLSYTELRTRILKATVMDASYSEKLLISGGCINAYNALAGIELHGLDDTAGWKAPESQNADDGESKSEGGGGGGGGCFIHTAHTGSSGLMALISLTLLALFRARPQTHRE